MGMSTAVSGCKRPGPAEITSPSVGFSLACMEGGVEKGGIKGEEIRRMNEAGGSGERSKANCAHTREHLCTL